MADGADKVEVVLWNESLAVEPLGPLAYLRVQVEHSVESTLGRTTCLNGSK